MMNFNTTPEQRFLLIYTSFTCIYLPAILILLYVYDYWYEVGSYKFSIVLLILTFIEIVKYGFSKLLRDQSLLISHNNRIPSKSRKKWVIPIQEFTKSILISILLTGVYFTVIVLFGAPLTTHHEETFMLALTMTTLTFIPASLFLGVNDALSILAGSQPLNRNLFFDAMRTNVKATILGAWLSAVVIPLDWDRPWQVWPIPCITGTLVGYLSGHFITLLKTLPLFIKISKKIYTSDF